MASKSKAAKAAADTSKSETNVTTTTNDTGAAQAPADTASAPAQDEKSATTENAAAPVAQEQPQDDGAAPTSESTGVQDENDGAKDPVGHTGDEPPVDEVPPPPGPETLTAPPPPSPEAAAQTTETAPETVTTSDTAPASTAVVETPTSHVGALVDPILEELAIPKAFDILADVPPAHYAVLAVLNRYVRETLGGNALSDDQVARNQDGVFRVMQNLINREEQYFVPIFTVMMLWFEKHGETALHPALAHRCEHLMRVNPDELRAYNNLIDLFRRLGPVKSRALEKKQISFDKALQYGLTDQGRSRVNNFFDV